MHLIYYLLTFVIIVITEPIFYYFMFLFMSTILQQLQKEPSKVDVLETKQIEPENSSINEILSRYFVWFTNNNIEEFQMFSKFCNQRFKLNISLFETKYIKIG